MRVSLTLLFIHIAATCAAGEVKFNEADGKLLISVDGKAVATYVFRDSKIPRPYFAHVNTPDGIQVTRTHPPVEGKDATDHADMHPGIWMAFGDLDGADFWRNKAKVVHVKFAGKPQGGTGVGSLVDERQYLRADGTEVCREDFRFELHVRPAGYLLTFDSTFTADRQFYFGDQEEMGLGVRVATPLSELNGGQLRDSEGRTGAKNIWSQSAAWCDYSGDVADRRVGMAVLCHPDNFRPSWMHARNYGLLVANPFGRKAMQKGQSSRVEVAPTKSLRLRYGVWVHSNGKNSADKLNEIFEEYLKL